jgi:preprotein translocase subunit YajC
MFLISDALAADAAAGGASAALMQFLPLILIIVVFWLFLIRPQQKREGTPEDGRRSQQGR